MSNANFNELVDLAMQEPGRVAMRPVVEKELLHYDIFSALDNAGLLKNLVFQGGTSLRLCRGSNRFSEDLDFAGGRDFNAAKMEAVKDCIEVHIGVRHGLDVKVKQPAAMAKEPDYQNVRVDTWQVSVQTAAARADMPKQSIKLEIANIPAYTRELLPLRLNYSFLQGAAPVLVNTESIDEIMADKMLAFAVSKSIRHRDVWDCAWLVQQGATLRPDLVMAKVADYHVEGYSAKLQARFDALPEIVRSAAFNEQMTRFIDAETIARTLGQPGFHDYLIGAMGGEMRKLLEEFGSVGVKDAAPKFQM